ncbi:MAG: hypothetical protein ACYS7Y_11840 [Planctomycetota bacterium]|jgi:hypothetical protein
MLDTTAILEGKYDSDLERIEAVCRERRLFLRAVKSATTMASVQVGNRVKIKNISPKYLSGATAIVTGKRRTKLEIELEKTHRRFHAGTPLIIPSSCVEIIQ